MILAFALRALRLGYPDLHGGEAFSVLFASQPWGQMFASLRTTEPHPPLYYLSLGLWMKLAGHSEFAVRFFSVLPGTLLVPLVYRLGRRLLGQETGLMAALLVTLNPFLVWYSQETRMYAPLALFALASFLAFLEAMERDTSLRSLASFVLLTTLGLYVHYFAFLTLVAENVAYTMLRRRSPLRTWLGAQVSVLFLYLPWLPSAWGTLAHHSKGWIRPVSLPQLLYRALSAYSLGRVAPGGAWAILAGFGLLALAGAWVLARRGREGMALLAYIFVPLLAVFVLSLLRPAFTERYLIAVVPAYALLLAGGLAWTRWGKAGRALGLLLVIGVSGYSLYGYYFLPRYARAPDWKEAVGYLVAHAEEGDVLVQNYPDPALVYYLQGAVPHVVLPASLPVDEEATEEELRTLLASHPRLWLLPYRTEEWDASGLVEMWLDAHAEKRQEARFRAIRLSLYLSPQLFLQGAKQVDARLGDVVRLVGYRLEEEQTSPGQGLDLTLYWQALGEMETDYTVFVHLLDGEGHIRGQKDNPPAQGTWPTGRWKPGELVVDRYRVPVNPDAPPGRYTLVVGMYDLETMQRLPAFDTHGKRLPEDRIPLTTVTITP